MAGRPETPTLHGSNGTSIGTSNGAFRLAAWLAVAFIMLVVARGLADVSGGAPPGGGADTRVVGSGADPSRTGDPGASIAVDGYLDPSPRAAPPLELTGPDGRTVSLADLRGAPALVFFGYTHCPDVCPATLGTVGQAIDESGGTASAIFVSIDPERDTVPWLAEFVRYMPAGFTAVTGSPPEVRATADAWGVRYARVEEADPSAYSMSHTADVFVIDASGQLRARLPFGTDVPAMTAVIRRVADTPAEPVPSSTAPASATPVPSPTSGPNEIEPVAPTLSPVVVSSAVWSGGHSPVIFSLYGADGRIDDPTLAVSVQLMTSDDRPMGPAVPAIAVRPTGIEAVAYIATMDIPSAGPWTGVVSVTESTGATSTGLLALDVLDPGATPRLGGPAPTTRTPTGADFGGDVNWVSTDPLPDPRLFGTSTVDALAAGRPFVLVVDSYRFKVTEVCGTALFLAKGLVDRWSSVTFIHHEPYRFTVVTTEPVLEGTLADPVLTEAAEAWGVGAPPWGVGSMPWMFVVDGDGTVRAKYQGLVGSADIDVILTLIERES
jgi:protein SCO1/2